MSIGKIIALFFGIIFLFTGIALTVSGVAIFAVSGVYTDSDGYLTSPSFQLESTDSVAFTVSDINVNIKNTAPQFIRNDLGSIATVRISASAVDNYFIGVGPSTDVSEYLQNVKYSEITDFNYVNSVEITTTTVNSNASAALTTLKPADQTFWDKFTTDNNMLKWVPKAGSWTIVIMKTDGSTGVDVSVQAGAKVPLLTPIATFLTIFGVMFIVLALVMFIVMATSNRKKLVTVNPYAQHHVTKVSEVPVQSYIPQQQLHGTPSAKVTQGTYTPESAQTAQQVTSDEEIYVVADWGQRILAYIIDIIVVSIFVEMIKLPAIIQDPTNSILLYPIGISANGIVLFVYFLLLESNYGTTIGKQALKLAVITEDGKKPELKETALSALGKAFFLPIDLLIGLIIRDETREVSLNQRLMQKVSRTLVVVKPDANQKISSGPYQSS